MKRPFLSIVGLTVLGLSGALVTGCASENLGGGGGGEATGGVFNTGTGSTYGSGSTGTGSTGSGGTFGSGSTAGVGGTSTGGASTDPGLWAAACTSVACGTVGLVDDFADFGDLNTKTKISAGNGTEGYWSTYAPAVAGVSITPIASAITATGLNVTAAGLTGTDGASISVNLNGVNSVSCALDVSAFTGITITGKAITAGSGHVSIRLLMPDVVPWNETYPGTCDPATKCWGPHAKTVDLPTTAGETTVLFSELAQPSWAKQVAFDPKKVIQFQIGSAPQSAGFDIQITKIEFTGAGTGTCTL